MPLNDRYTKHLVVSDSATVNPSQTPENVILVNSAGQKISTKTDAELNSRFVSTVEGTAQAAIQAALDAVPADGGTVRLRDVAYDALTTSLKVKSNTTFDLGKARLTLAAGANTDIIRNADPYTGNTGITIIGGILDGNRTNQTSGVSAEPTNASADGPGRSGITLMNVTKSTVAFPRITAPWHHGIDVGTTDEQDDSLRTLLTGTITGTFTGTVTGGTSGATGTYVTTGVDSRSQRYVVLDAVTGTFESGETITSPGGASAVTASAALTHGCTDITIINPKIDNFGDDGVTTHFASFVSIVAPVCWDAAASYSGQSNGVEIDDGSHDVTISDHLIHDCVNGIKFQAHSTRPPAYNCTVNGGVISDCTGGFDLDAPGTAHASVVAKNITINGGVVRDCANGIIVTNYQNVAVNGTAFDTCTDLWESTAYAVIARTKNISFNDCLIHACGMNLNVSEVYSECPRFSGNTITGATSNPAVNIDMDDVHFERNTIGGSSTHAIKVVAGTKRPRIIGNTITGCGGVGITVTGAVEDYIISDNRLVGNVSTTAELWIGTGGGRGQITNNVIDATGYGMRVEGDGSQVYVTNNTIKGSSAAVRVNQGTPTGYTFDNNVGYKATASGATASVADGGTITHGLAAAPTKVRCTSSVAGEFVSVTALGASTFTVAIKKHDNSAGTPQTVYWEASIW